jgi:hypothetical protein
VKGKSLKFIYNRFESDFSQTLHDLEIDENASVNEDKLVEILRSMGFIFTDKISTND